MLGRPELLGKHPRIGNCREGPPRSQEYGPLNVRVNTSHACKHSTHMHEGRLMRTRVNSICGIPEDCLNACSQQSEGESLSLDSKLWKMTGQ